MLIGAAAVTGSLLIPRAGVNPEPHSTAVRDGGLSVEDLRFLKRTAEWMRAQRELARLAQAGTDDARVEELSEQVDADLQQALDRLDTLADDREVDLNDGLGAEGLKDSDRRVRDQLGTVHGRARDRAWIQLALGNFVRGLELLEPGTGSGDPGIKAYADETLPVLKARMADLEQLQRDDTAKPSSLDNPAP